MTGERRSKRRPRYLRKKDVLDYYYSTYIGAAILLLLVIAIKFERLPLVLNLAFIVIVIARILYGVKIHVHAVSCPFCGDGELKRRWAANAYYLVTLPLERERFTCPNCGKEVEILDRED